MTFEGKTAGPSISQSFFAAVVPAIGTAVIVAILEFVHLGGDGMGGIVTFFSLGYPLVGVLSIIAGMVLRMNRIRARWMLLTAVQYLAIAILVSWAFEPGRGGSFFVPLMLLPVVVVGLTAGYACWMLIDRRRSAKDPVTVEQPVENSSHSLASVGVWLTIFIFILAMVVAVQALGTSLAIHSPTSGEECVAMAREHYPDDIDLQVSWCLENVARETTDPAVCEWYLTPDGELYRSHGRLEECVWFGCEPAQRTSSECKLTNRAVCERLFLGEYPNGCLVNRYAPYNSPTAPYGSARPLT